MRNIFDVIYEQHDIVCNQKYDKVLPYSFHLKAVLAQCNKYISLLPIEVHTAVKIAAAGHDLIEDARMTYNDIRDMLIGWGYKDPQVTIICDIIYACTELKGKTRPERHSQEYFNALQKNRLGVFVKLCDIMANILFSKLTDSSMFAKYKAEFPYLKIKLYSKGEYDPIWEDLERTLGF